MTLTGSDAPVAFLGLRLAAVTTSDENSILGL